MPQVMVKVMRRVMGTLRDAYCSRYASYLLQYGLAWIEQEKACTSFIVIAGNKADRFPILVNTFHLVPRSQGREGPGS